MEERPDPENLTAPTASEAFVATYSFAGQPLKAFSPRREMVAQACGHRLLSNKAKMEGLTAYDGAFFDVALVLWLCTLENAEVDKALRAPGAAITAALDFADANGLSFGSEAFNEALEIHCRIIGNIFASRFAVVPDSDAPKKKADEPPSPTDGSLNT